MPASDLQKQLDSLREQLDKTPPLSFDDRAELNKLAEQIDAQIKVETAIQDASLVDNVNLAVERFEVEHPTLAGTLRNIVQTLGNIGI